MLKKKILERISFWKIYCLRKLELKELEKYSVQWLEPTTYDLVTPTQPVQKWMTLLNLPVLTNKKYLCDRGNS